MHDPCEENYERSKSRLEDTLFMNGGTISSPQINLSMQFSSKIPIETILKKTGVACSL